MKNLFLVSLALATILMGCGKTQVRLTNSTGGALTQATVSVYQSGSSNTKTFTGIADGATTDAQDWGDDGHLTVSVDVSGYSETTDSVTLDTGKLNTITLTLSSGNIVYTRAAN